MATQDFKVELDRQIEAKRKELEALETARRVLFSGETVEKTATYNKSGSDDKNDGELDLDLLGVEIAESGPTLVERVEDAVTQIPMDREFTVPHVEAILKQSGFEVPGKHPRSRLAMTMSQLEEKGLVIRTAKPKGFKPHRFKRAKKKGITLVK